MWEIALFALDVDESPVAALIVQALQGSIEMGVYVQCLLRLAIAVFTHGWRAIDAYSAMNMLSVEHVLTRLLALDQIQRPQSTRMISQSPACAAASQLSKAVSVAGASKATANKPVEGEIAKAFGVLARR